MDEYENKGLAKWVPWKCLKIRGIVGRGSGADEFQNGKSGGIPSVAIERVRKWLKTE
jgi:hypothetical protein